MIAAAADIIVFILATARGFGLAEAHIASFAVAVVLNYFLRVAGPAVAAGRGVDWRLYVRLLVVALFAVFLRGGVLGLLVNRWGMPAQVAIVFAALAALAITLPGNSMALRSGPWKLDGSDSSGSIAVWLVAMAFALRLVYLAQVELLPEDSYYWNYAQHPAPGYLDHPPMVALWIHLGVFLAGPTPLGVRLGGPIAALSGS